MGSEINLTYLYPDILNLHGDRGNVLAFEKIGKMMGIKVSTKRIDSLDEQIDFDNTDIILLSPGELKVIGALKNAFEMQIEKLKNYIENDGYVFCIGTTIALFGKEISFEDGRSESGLGIIDFDTKEMSKIYGDDLLFNLKFNDRLMKVSSTQINAINISLGNNAKAFADVDYGYGNDKSGKEGAMYKNLICTNALGPIFIKNPWLTKEVLLDIARKKDIDIITDELDFSLEEASMKEIESFVELKK